MWVILCEEGAKFAIITRTKMERKFSLHLAILVFWRIFDAMMNILENKYNSRP
jgi:hypothetical protein